MIIMVSELPSKSPFKKLTKFKNWFNQIDIFTKVSLLTMLLILLAVPIIATQQTNRFSKADNENLLQNGSFENYSSGSFANWNFSLQATDSATITQSVIEKEDGNSSAQINVIAASSSANAIQLYQPGLTLAPVSYTLSFWAKADQDRNIEVVVQHASEPSDTYSQQSESVSTSWVQKTITFTPSDPDTNAKVAFSFAETTGTVWVDNVVLVETAGTPTPAPTQAPTYYVSPTGNDSDSGTQAQPWLTIQHAADTAVAGDIVERLHE